MGRAQGSHLDQLNLREDHAVSSRTAASLQVRSHMRYTTEDGSHNAFQSLFTLRKYNGRRRQRHLSTTVESQGGTE